MSGFTTRRFTLQNIAAVAAHCPVPGVSQTALKILHGPAAAAAVANASAAASAAGAAPSDRPVGSASSPEARDYAERLPDGGQVGLAAWLSSLLVGAPSFEREQRQQSQPAGSSRAAAGSRFSLLTEEEMLWVQRRRREEAEESRVVLAARPTRSLLRGLGGGLLNVAVGCFLSPLIALSIALERIRVSQNFAVGLVVGPLYGTLWGSLFLATALYAAVQQAVLSVFYGCVAAPLHYCTNRPRPPSSSSSAGAAARFWSPLCCRFAPAQGVQGSQCPLLFCYDSDETLRERAMRRLSKRRDADGSTTAHYAGRQRRDGEAPSASDYYGLLGVDKKASQRQIKAAYNQLVLTIHPDRSSAPNAAEHFDRVTKAYRVLVDSEKRRKYDAGGVKGVEDLGARKRDGVRALFGGDALGRLVGDVLLGSFSQRVIDGVDFTQEELAVLRQRMYERCRDELLGSYLAHYVEADARSASPAPAPAVSLKAWDASMAQQLRKITSTGLAKEVLFVVGAEYRRVVQYFDAAQRTGGQHAAAASGAPAETIDAPQAASLLAVAARRAQLYTREVAPHRWSLSAQKWRSLLAIRSSTFKDSEALVNVAWSSCVEELERTARTTALTVLFDAHVDAAEVRRRRAALLALADVFAHYGQPYKGANKSTMDQLMSSLRAYQQQREREKSRRD